MRLVLARRDQTVVWRLQPEVLVPVAADELRAYAPYLADLVRVADGDVIGSDADEGALKRVSMGRLVVECRTHRSPCKLGRGC